MEAFGRYQWHAPQIATATVETLAEQLGVSSVLASILAARGYTPQSAARLLYGTALRPPEQLPALARMAAQLRSFLASSEPILVIGGPSMDAISAVAILNHAFRSIGGRVRFSFSDPNTRGYALDPELIERAGKHGIRRFCLVGPEGIEQDALSALSRIGGQVWALLRSPHPHIPAAHTLSPAPPYPFADLALSGLAFKLAQKLLGTAMAERLMILAAIGILADELPVVEENRVLVRRALPHLHRTTIAGVASLKAELGIRADVSPDYPQIRKMSMALAALSRYAGASATAQLLITRNRQVAAELAAKARYAHQLFGQASSPDFPAKALPQFRTLNRGTQSFYLLCYQGNAENDGTWHGGMALPLARQLAQSEQKTAVILLPSASRWHGLAVGRPGSDPKALMAALTSCADTTAVFGNAIWFTFPAARAEEMKHTLAVRLHQLLPAGYGHGNPSKPPLFIDTWLKPHQLTLDLMTELRLLEPFGNGNPQPLIGMQGLRAVRRYFAPPPTHLMRTYLQDLLTGVRLAAEWPKQMGYELAPDTDTYVNVIGWPSCQERNGKWEIRFQIRDWLPVAGREHAQAHFTLPKATKKKNRAAM